MAAAGEHRYEDSYFLKRDKASTSAGDTSSSTENGNVAKRTKIEVPASGNVNAKDDSTVKAAAKEEDSAAAGGSNGKVQCTIH